jgi:hypothetical protein
MWIRILVVLFFAAVFVLLLIASRDLVIEAPMQFTPE